MTKSSSHRLCVFVTFVPSCDSTIVALATAPGRGALALVRLAGPDAFAIAGTVARGFDPSRPRVARLLQVRGHGGEVVDRALVTAFPAPHSYSGEDTVEFSTHGGVFVPAQVMGACLAAGARLALPGEFSRRAVIHGKLDLLQAEAVGDLVDATAPAQARQATLQLGGALSERIERIRATVLGASARLAYAIDFPEEDDGPLDLDVVATAINEVQQRLLLMVEASIDGERVRRGALVVLVGPPNVGKSSLFNRLVGRDRAIVADTPGTTRDAIEAEVSLDGWPVTLVDTAGIRDDAEAVEVLGIAVSRTYWSRADLVLQCRDAREMVQISESSFTEDPRIVSVWTKVDSLPATSVSACGVCHTDRDGELRARLVGQLCRKPVRRPRRCAVPGADRISSRLHRALADAQLQLQQGNRFARRRWGRPRLPADIIG